MASLAACTSPGVSPPASPIEAGGSTCQLPKASANPAQVKAGESVHITGEWFVVGCGGAGGTSPMKLMGISFIDASGNSKGLNAIDASGPTGTIDVRVPIPADAPEGISKIIIGRSGPIRFDVYALTRRPASHRPSGDLRRRAQPPAGPAGR